MNCRIEPVPEFKAQVKRLLKKYRSLKADLQELNARLRLNPFMGESLGNGLHKIRMAITSKGSGKSGGARVITYAVEESGDDYLVRLISIYDKSEIELIPVGELKKVLRANGLE